MYPNLYEWDSGIQFNDYRDEDTVFIDEFDKLDFGVFRWDYWLRLFDKWPFTARILYGTKPIRAETYILCMNQDPLTLFAGVGWQRRVAEATVIHWTVDQRSVELASLSQNGP